MKSGIYETLANHPDHLQSIKFDRTYEEERVISAQRNLDLGPVSQKIKQLLRLVRSPIGRALATSLVLIVLLTACGGEAINPETEVTTVPTTKPTEQPTKTATAEPSATPEATSTPTVEEYLRNVFNFPSHIKIINGTDLEVEALKEIEGLQEDGLYQWEHRFVSEGATLVLKIDQHGRPYFLLEEGSLRPITTTDEDEDHVFYPAEDNPVIFFYLDDLVPALPLEGTHFVTWDLEGGNQIVYLEMVGYDDETSEFIVRVAKTALTGEPADNGGETYRLTTEQLEDLGAKEEQLEEARREFEEEEEVAEDREHALSHEELRQLISNELIRELFFPEDQKGYGMEFIDSNTGGGVILTIDGTIETELGPIRSFKLSSEMPLTQEEIREKTAEYAMQMHYYAWQQQNPGRTETFEQYLDLVANGGGRYSIQASKEGVNPDTATLEDILDNERILGARIKKFETVVVDPSKPVVIIATHGSNQYNPARSASQTYWPIVTSDGQVYFRIKIIDVDYTRGEIDVTKEYFGLTMLRALNIYGVWASSEPSDLSLEDGKEVWLETNPEQREYGSWFNPESIDDFLENEAFIIGEIGEISE